MLLKHRLVSETCKKLNFSYLKRVQLLTHQAHSRAAAELPFKPTYEAKKCFVIPIKMKLMTAISDGLFTNNTFLANVQQSSSAAVQQCSSAAVLLLLHFLIASSRFKAAKIRLRIRRKKSVNAIFNKLWFREKKTLI